MFRALIRFLFFEIPLSVLSGLSYIFFDGDEIIGCGFKVQDQINKRDKENKVLVDYLNRCRKQVYKKDKGK